MQCAGISSQLTIPVTHARPDLKKSKSKLRMIQLGWFEISWMRVW
jgi:hypothetical protein